MRVLVVSRSAYPLHGYGGLERHVGQAIEFLKNRGTEVTLLTRPPTVGGARTAAQHEVHVPYARFPFRPGTLLDRNTNYLLWVWSLARILRELEPSRHLDVIYGHGLAGIAGPLASGRLGALTCLNPHGLEEFRTPGAAKRLAYWPSRMLERAYAPRCGAVIATDEALLPVVSRCLIVKQERIAVVPNAVDLESIDVRIAACGPSHRHRHGITRIVCTGRLERNKGQAVLVRAVAGLPDTELILVGDGSQRSALASLISKLGLRGRVSLAGNLTDLEMTALYLSADIYCQPSLYEGSSIAVLEAMAHGLPVVAARTGGLPDKVIPGRTGFLVDPGSTEQLAQALAVLRDDPELRAAMGRNGRELVRSKYSWHVVGTRLLETLQSVAAG